MIAKALAIIAEIIIKEIFEMANTSIMSISVPKPLEAEIKKNAKAEGISVSQYIINKIEANSQKPVDPYTLEAKIDSISAVVEMQKELIVKLIRQLHFQTTYNGLMLQQNLRYASAQTEAELKSIPKWNAELNADFEDMARGATADFFDKLS